MRQDAWPGESWTQLGLLEDQPRMDFDDPDGDTTMQNDSDRFDNYRDIDARFNSTGSCGHAIKKGQAIGYNPRNKRTQCAECWRVWQLENANAAGYEQYGSDCLFDY